MLLAQLNPGLDNLTFVGDRLFVSNFTGEITEILTGGQTRTVLPGGLEVSMRMYDDSSAAACAVTASQFGSPLSARAAAASVSWTCRRACWRSSATR